MTVTIYDALGRRVRTLLDGTRPAGPQELAWDGRDDAGERSPRESTSSELDADGAVATRKITILR